LVRASLEPSRWWEGLQDFSRRTLKDEIDADKEFHLGRLKTRGVFRFEFGSSVSARDQLVAKSHTYPFRFSAFLEILHQIQFNSIQFNPIQRSDLIIFLPLSRYSCKGNDNKDDDETRCLVTVDAYKRSSFASLKTPC
jgi:hypothetical protein